MEMIAYENILTDKTGGNKKLKQSDYLEKGSLAIVDQGQKMIAGYTNDLSLKANVKLPCIIFGDHTRIFKYVNFPFALGADGVKILEPSEKLFPLYAYYFLGQVKLSGKEGYNRNYKYLKEISVPVPDLKTQQKIASILKQADAARQKRKQANQLTEQFLQSAFLEMFGDPMENEKGWALKELGETVDMKGGGTPSKSKPEYFTGEIPWVSPKDMKFDYITTSQDKITEVAVRESATNLISPHSILIVVRSGILKNTLPVAINVVPVTINQDMKALMPKKFINHFYLMFAIKQAEKRILQKVRGTTADNINTDDLKKLEISVPPLPLQQKFASLVEQVEQLRVKQRESEKELENLFGSLMQRYFG